MPRRVVIARVSDVVENVGEAYPIDNRMIAVFLHNGEYYAMDDFCPHMGASLAGGCLYEGSISCPWHAWRFNLKDGTWLENPKIKTTVYPIFVEGENLVIELPDE
jgi:nitrite reductase (NADH) small subunit/3-phenylpropionate/trans-cinnamate dioxygenase ferredoxin subunit